MKNIPAVFLSLIIFVQPAMADDKSDVDKLLKDKLDSVIALLQKKDLDEQAKKSQITDIVTPMFDFSLMAKLSLGKKHWSVLDTQKKARFEELFIKLLKESYLEKFTLYTDETIAYKTPVQIKTKIQIPTELISKENTISMLYKFYKSSDKWLIYDIEIQGVSIIKTYKSQFDQILSSGTIDDLLKEMEKPKKQENN